MATIPTLSAAVAGQRMRAAMYNAIKTYLDWLHDPIRCEVYCASPIAVANGGTGTVVFDTEVSDTDSMHSTSVNPSRVIFQTAGRYEVRISTLMSGSVTYTQYDVNPRVNSGGSSSGGSSIRTFNFGSPGGASPQQQVTLRRFFNAADYIEVFISQTSGASRNIQGSGFGLFGTGVQATYVGPT